MLKVTCRKCLAVLKLSDDRRGKTIRCPVCFQALHVVAAAAGSTVMIRHACVRCGTVLEVPDTHAGKMQECPTCGTRLMVSAAALSGLVGASARGIAGGQGAAVGQGPQREHAQARQLAARDCGQLAIVAATPFEDPEMIRLCRQGRDLIRSVQQCNNRVRKLREMLAGIDPKAEHAKFVEVRQHLAIIERKSPKIQRALNSLATTLGQIIIDQAPQMPQFRKILQRLRETPVAPEAAGALPPPQGRADDLSVSGTLWYCRIDGQAYGPTDAAGLVTWARQGNIKLDDAVRSEEMPQWLSLKDVRDLPPQDQRRCAWPGEFMQALAAMPTPSDGGAAADTPSLWRHGADALRKAASRVGLLRKEDDLAAHPSNAHGAH
ncbi:MAG: GYF domain-containing protein [Planctomycetaceae bacterium]|nr:GYF domain-containing protein [Planctomycetaceae bacterium]